MVRQTNNRCVFTTRCPDADELTLCGDCLGWFAMRRIDAERWQVQLELPAGQHHFRYYVRRGLITALHNRDDVEVSGSESTDTGDGSRSESNQVA